MIYKPNLKKRIIATIIDYGLYLLIFCAFVEYFGHNNLEGGKSVEGWLALIPIPVWFIYFIGLESAFMATPGHRALGLKVIALDGNRIDLWQAIKRHLMDCIDILIYGIPAIIAIKNTEKHQRLGDLWAKTVVVDTNDSEQLLDVDNEIR